MADVIITEAVKIVAALLLMLIGVLGTWMTKQIAKGRELANDEQLLTNISLAIDELILAAQQTVGELEQTSVKDMKAANLDGKLTDEEVTALGINLYNITTRKLSDPAKRLLEAASVDIQAMITSAAEDWINTLRSTAPGGAGVAAIGFQPESEE